MTQGAAPFPSDEVNRNLESSVASKRQRGFAMAEDAVQRGATISLWTLRLIEGIALRPAASAPDRWRAIELLRFVGISQEVLAALIREWVLVPGSTAGPVEHDSGPMFYVVQQVEVAFDQAFDLMAAAELAAISRVVIRDLLVAMRARLVDKPERVRDDQAAAWRTFCTRVRELDPRGAQPNEGFLLDAIIKAIDG